MTSSQPVRRFDWNNLGIRAASAVVLIPAAVAAVFFGGWVLLLLVSVAVALLALEWGGMSAPGAPIRIAAAVMVAVLAALFVAYYGHYRIAWAIAGVGAVVAAIVGRSLSERAGDAAYGVIYIAPAVLALFWIRAMPNGISWTIMVFAVAWAADIFAFAVGSAAKGPKLWPRFSPNKTWSGFFGGLAGAMVAALLVSRFTDAKLTLLSAALVGLAGGLATMAGDLWESMLKRRFGVKDSGDLIPGHGGLLDRVDGLMFAIVVVAAARLMQLEGLLQ
ncbi:MAG TPA: phosphatidate cytidylyltransferase [Caulobacteraceae bacterium]|nr:phosphatidate cytidylyltransferase [Caulobacteraceae bacterium]